MRLGIRKIDPKIKKGEIIQIVDEKNHRSLAVGKAMFDAKNMVAKTSGKAIKNVHTINDKIWTFEKQFK